MTDPPAAATIHKVVSDAPMNRVAITVNPCAGATYFTVCRRLDRSRSGGDPIRALTFVPATGVEQTFYDYECPMGVAADYQVISYSGSNPLYTAPDVPEPVGPSLVLLKEEL